MNVSYSSLAQVLNLYPYDDVHKDVKIFKDSEMYYFINFRIPDIFNHLTLLSVKSCEDSSICLDSFIARVCGKPWIQIESRALNRNIGQHTYKFEFVDVHTNDVSYLYAAYIIQSDDPPRSYDYMKEARNICSKQS